MANPNSSRSRIEIVVRVATNHAASAAAKA